MFMCFTKWSSVINLCLFLKQSFLIQGILKGKYHTTVWLVCNQLYDNWQWQFLFLFAKQTNLKQSNRRSTEQRYFPFLYSLVHLSDWRKSAYPTDRNEYKKHKLLLCWVSPGWVAFCWMPRKYHSNVSWKALSFSQKWHFWEWQSTDWHSTKSHFTKWHFT